TAKINPDYLKETVTGNARSRAPPNLQRQWHPDHHLIPVQRQEISGGVRQQRQSAEGIPLPPAEDVDDGPAVPADGRQSGVPLPLPERSPGDAATTDQEQWGDRLACDLHGVR